MDSVKPQLQTVTFLAVSPAEEVLVCSTSASQLYSFSLSSTDTGKVICLHVQGGRIKNEPLLMLNSNVSRVKIVFVTFECDAFNTAQGYNILDDY